MPYAKKDKTHVGKRESKRHDEWKQGTKNQGTK